MHILYKYEFSCQARCQVIAHLYLHQSNYKNHKVGFKSTAHEWLQEAAWQKSLWVGTTVVFLWAIPSKVIHCVNIVFMYLCVQNSWQWINNTPPFSRISSSWRSNAITCSGMYLATQLIESHWGLWTTLLPTLHRFHGNPYAQVIKNCLDEQISPVTKKRWTLCAFRHIAKCYRFIAKCR